MSTNDKSDRKISCGEGKYTYKDRASSSTDCLDCPPGYYCPENPTTKNDKMLPCPAGYYCLGGNSDITNSVKSYEETPCPAGFYCPLGTNVPIPCDVGKYCEQGSHTPTGSCTEGYTCELIQYDYTDTIVDRPAWVNIFESATVQGTLTYDGIEFCMNEDSANCWRGHYQAATAGNECP